MPNRFVGAAPPCQCTSYTAPFTNPDTGASPDSDIDPTKFGNVIEANIVMIDVPGWCDAGGGPLSGDAPVSGFVKGAVYDVHWQGGAAPTKRFGMRIDLTTV